MNQEGAPVVDISSVSSQIPYCTVRLTGHRSDGSESVGTAFFFTFSLEGGREIPVLVTNKHVVAGCERGSFLLRQEEPAGTPSTSFSVEISNFEAVWIQHPGGSDICVMPIGVLLDTAQRQGKEIFRRAFEEDHIPTQESLSSLSALEDIIMVGYPIGLWDSTNNLPICRKGMTATHPAVDFNNLSEGFVDIAAFPGSSGSPVFILNEGSYSDPQGLVFGTRFMLLGILYAGPQFKVDGTLEIVEIPTAQKPIIRTTIPVHLGMYVKARELLAVKDVLVEAMQA